jgi:mRNA interferase RelE/StbE
VSPPPRLRVPPEVAALLRGLHPELKRRIRGSFDRILDDPGAGKALRGELTGLRSLRVGRIRIVYRERRAVIEVVALGPRDHIYEETLRLLRGSPAAEMRKPE